MKKRSKQPPTMPVRHKTSGHTFFDSYRAPYLTQVGHCDPRQPRQRQTSDERVLGGSFLTHTEKKKTFGKKKYPLANICHFVSSCCLKLIKYKIDHV